MAWLNVEAGWDGGEVIWGACVSRGSQLGKLRVTTAVIQALPRTRGMQAQIEGEIHRSKTDTSYFGNWNLF